MDKRYARRLILEKIGRDAAAFVAQQPQSPVVVLEGARVDSTPQPDPDDHLWGGTLSRLFREPMPWMSFSSRRNKKHANKISRQVMSEDIFTPVLCPAYVYRPKATTSR